MNWSDTRQRNSFHGVSEISLATASPNLCDEVRGDVSNPHVCGERRYDDCDCQPKDDVELTVCIPVCLVEVVTHVCALYPCPGASPYANATDSGIS